MCSPALCSTASRWAFMRRRRSFAMPSSTASRCARSTSTSRDSSTCWSRHSGARAASGSQHAEMRDDIRSTKCNPSRASRRSSASSEDHANRSSRASRRTGYTSVRDLWLRTGLPIAALREAGRGRCVRLARTQPARGALGGARPDRHRRRRDAAAVQNAGHRRRLATRPIRPAA